MERSLLWISFGVGLAGWACCAVPALAHRARSRTPLPLSLMVVLCALPVAVFAVSLLGRAPFTPGCGFGAGFLLGGISSWMSLAALRLDTRPPRSAMATASRAVAAWLPPVATLAIVQLLLRANLVDTLAGAAIGWFCTAALLWIAAPRAEGEPALPAEDLAAALVFAVLLASMGMLAAIRGSDLDESMKWSAVVSVLAAAAPLAVLVATLPSGPLAAQLLRIPGAGLLVRLVAGRARDDEARGALAVSTRATVAAVLLIGLARLVEKKLLTGADPLVEAKVLGMGELTCCTVVGLAAAVLVSWLVAKAAEDDTPAAGPPLLAVLVVLGAFMVAHQLMGGFGCAVALLAGWTLNAARLASMAPQDRAAGAQPALPSLMVFGLILLLYRTIEARFASDLRGGVLVDHYGLFGILLAAALPSIAAARIERQNRPGIEIAVIACLLVLAAPSVVILVWGPKCVPAMVIGLALSVALAPQAALRSSAGRMSASIVAIATALALCQWTSHVMRAAVLTRAERAHILYWIAGALIAVLLASNIAAAVGARRKGAAREPAR